MPKKDFDICVLPEPPLPGPLPSPRKKPSARPLPSPGLLLSLPFRHSLASFGCKPYERYWRIWDQKRHTTMWAALFLQQNPHVFKKAKAGREEIIRNRPTGQKGLTIKELRKMDYVSKVIDETLHVVSFSFMVFREAKKHDFIPNAGNFLPFGGGSRLCMGMI